METSDSVSRNRPYQSLRDPLVFSVGVLWLITSQSAWAESIQAIVCPIRSNHITVDGVLNDPAWDELEAHGDFIIAQERSPHHGVKRKHAREQTSFKVFAHGPFLYVGIEALDHSLKAQMHSENISASLYEDEVHISKRDLINDRFRRAVCHFSSSSWPSRSE